MARYVVTFFARATGGDIPLHQDDSPAGALKYARVAAQQGYSSVAIVDGQSLERWDADAFAKAHKLN